MQREPNYTPTSHPHIPKIGACAKKYITKQKNIASSNITDHGLILKPMKTECIIFDKSILKPYILSCK